MFVGVHGHLSGYGSFGPCRDEGWVGAEVRTLFVDPGSWGAGVADALMEWGFGRLVREGWERLAVWSFVTNERANRFYRRWGFRDDGTRAPKEAFAGVQAARLTRAL